MLSINYIKEEENYYKQKIKELIEKDEYNIRRSQRQQEEIERLNNIIKLIKNNIDITIQIIKEQPTGNDEWILERLNGIRNIGEKLGGDDNE